MSIIPDEEVWKQQGLCHGCAPNPQSKVRQTHPFFPTGRGKRAAQEAVKAKHVCEGCPVRTICLKTALSRADEMGIWGGTDEKERKQIRKDLGL